MVDGSIVRYVASGERGSREEGGARLSRGLPQEEIRD